MNQQPPGATDLTLEDLAAIRRCRKESFWRRCVPMIIGGSLAVGFAHGRGMFSTYPRLLYPTYFLVGVTGYLGGKMSYLKRCKQMFLELQDSRVKDFLQGELPQMPSPSYPDFGSGDGLRRSLQRDAPLVVDTPPASPEQSPNQPMTYAQRREFYRRHQVPRQRAQPPPFTPMEEEEEPQSSSFPPPPPPSDYFDEDRPMSSFLSDDAYRPRD